MASPQLFTWVISFADRTVRLVGVNDVIAAHVNIPRALPRTHYYSLKFARSLNVNAFNWIWSYLNGMVNEANPLSPVDALDAVLYLEDLKIGGLSYLALKVINSVLSRAHGPSYNSNATELINDYIKLFFNAGYQRQILKTGSGTSSNYPLPVEISNYFTIMDLVYILKDLKEVPLLPSYEIIPLDEQWENARVGAMVTMIFPLMGNTYMPELTFNRIFAERHYTGQIPIPAEILEWIGEERPIMYAHADLAPSYTGDILYRGPMIPVEIFIVDNRDMLIVREGVPLTNIPWFLRVIRQKIPTLINKIMTPFTTFSPSIPSGERNFLLGSVRVPGYPTVFRERSMYMRAMPDERDVLVIKEEPTPPLLYAWYYVNGIDNCLNLAMSLGEAVRIFHYLNYFNVDLTSDLYNGFLSSLSTKIINEGESLSPQEKKLVLSEFIGNIRNIRNRKALLVFHGVGQGSCLVDQAVAVLLDKRLSPPFGYIEEVEIFTLKFAGVARPSPDVGKAGRGGRLGAIYGGYTPNGAKVDLPYPLFVTYTEVVRGETQSMSVTLDYGDQLPKAVMFSIGYREGQWEALVKLKYEKMLIITDMIVAEVVVR